MRAFVGLTILLLSSPADGRLWSLQLEGTTQVETSESGIVYAAGRRDAGAPRSHEILLHRLDASGQLAWSREFGRPGSDALLELVVDPAGRALVLVKGLSESYVCRFDPDGDLDWCTSLVDWRPTALEAAQDGGVLLADIYSVARLADDGGLAWTSAVSCEDGVPSEPVITRVAAGSWLVGRYAPPFQSNHWTVACAVAYSDDQIHEPGVSLDLDNGGIWRGAMTVLQSLSGGDLLIGWVHRCGDSLLRNCGSIHLQRLDAERRTKWAVEIGSGLFATEATELADGTLVLAARANYWTESSWLVSVSPTGELGWLLESGATDVAALPSGDFVAVESDGRLTRRTADLTAPGLECVPGDPVLGLSPMAALEFSAWELPPRWDGWQPEMAPVTPEAMDVSIPVTGECDNCDSPSAPDGDGDGVADACDLCPEVPDPEQLDDDGDGYGAACDPTPGDEPSAVDLRPTAPALRIGPEPTFGLALQFSWEDTGAEHYTVHAQPLAALRAGESLRRRLRCGITLPLFAVAKEQAGLGSQVYLVSAWSGGVESSLGRDSFGRERYATRGEVCP